MNLDEQRSIERSKYLDLAANHPRYGISNHGRRVVDRLRFEKPKRVADFGCGRNQFVEQTRNVVPGVDARGIDFAFSEADIAAPMHKVPLPDGWADCVTSFDALEHLVPDDVEGVIAEMARIAKPGARFFASICFRPSRYREGLHPTVKPRQWWLRKLADVMRIEEVSPFIVGTFGAQVDERLNPGDASAVSRGTRKPTGDGLRVWTSDFREVSLGGWLRGRSVFLVLSGPSLNSFDLSQLGRRGIVTLGVNNSWLVHRPNLWLCVDTPDRFADVGWQDPGIVKFVPAEFANTRLRIDTQSGKRESPLRVSEMPSVFLYRRSDTFDHKRFVDTVGVSWGCPSSGVDSLGIQGKRSCMQAAIALLSQLGAGTIYLVGADFRMAPDSRYAFDEARTPEAIRHNNVLYESLDERFRALAPHLADRGVRVFNCTEPSGLSAFDHVQFADAIEDAVAVCDRPTDSRGWYEPAKGSQ